MRKMTSVMERTSIDRPKAERAGVPAGSKMVVGDCARASPATKNRLQADPRKIHADAFLVEEAFVGECPVIGDKAV